MISIIICSRSNELASRLSANIKATIGVDYEIIVIDNSNNSKSIFAAYNKGAEKARFASLCFIHEDIEFISTDWGEIIVSLLQDSETGVIGVAGSKYLPKNPAPWWISLKDFSVIKKEGILFYNIIHGEPDLINNNVVDRLPPGGWKIEKVSIVDGVFIGVRRDVWNEFKFDEKTFNHFHFYDIDFSASVGVKYNNYVTGKILVKHFSGGNMDIHWLIGAVSFHKKWKNKLPLNLSSIPKKTKNNFENIAATEFCEMCLKFQYYPLLFIKYWVSSLKFKAGSRNHFMLLLRYFSGALFSGKK